MAIFRTGLCRLNLLFLLAFFITACESEEAAITEIGGIVTDMETNAPIADANISLMVSEGLDITGFINPITTSTSTNDRGAYTFVLPTNDKQKLYLVIPEKNGFVEVKESTYIASTLKNNERNQHDIKLARGSYLNLSVKKASDSPLTHALRVLVNQLQDPAKAPQLGHLVSSELINLTATSLDTTLNRGYYYKHGEALKIRWDIIDKGSDTVIESHETTMQLVEYGASNFEIRY
jgi:hypothetical protein